MCTCGVHNTLIQLSHPVHVPLPHQRGQDYHTFWKALHSPKGVCVISQELFLRIFQIQVKCIFILSFGESYKHVNMELLVAMPPHHQQPHIEESEIMRPSSNSWGKQYWPHPSSQPKSSYVSFWSLVTWIVNMDCKPPFPIMLIWVSFCHLYPKGSWIIHYVFLFLNQGSFHYSHESYVKTKINREMRNR